MPFAIATHAAARVVSAPRAAHARTPDRSAAPRSAPLPRASRGASVVTRGLNTDKSYNCVVNNEGVIISEDFPSGTYEVTSWWHGSQDEEEEAHIKSDYAAVSSSMPGDTDFITVYSTMPGHKSYRDPIPLYQILYKSYKQPHPSLLNPIQILQGSHPFLLNRIQIL